MASLEQRDGKTSTTWRVVWTEDGKRRQIGFTTALKAAEFKLQVEAFGNRLPPGWSTSSRATAPSSDRLTFRRWADRAIANRTRANPRTRADYVRDLDRHFAMLADVALTDIDDDHITAWLADRARAGLADKTIRNLHGFASSLFMQALRQHPPLVERNPFISRLPDRASVRVEEMVFLTPEEFALVQSHMRHEYRALFSLLFGTGLRFGEATALTVADVHLMTRRPSLQVVRAWKRAGPTEWVIGEPKTARSRRTLTLSHELVLILAEATAGKRGSDLVFSRPSGARLPHTEVWKRGWAPAVARANVCDRHYAEQRDGRNQPPTKPHRCDCYGVLDKTPRIHDVRHSHASLLIADGLPITVISRRLGHSSIQVTIDRYGHLDPRLDDGVNASVDRALRSGRIGSEVEQMSYADNSLN